MTESYDAVLVVSFGGPEGANDGILFLKNVFRDKKVPPPRSEPSPLRLVFSCNRDLVSIPLYLLALDSNK